MPVPIVDGGGNAAGYVSMAKIITQTNLSILDLQVEREGTIDSVQVLLTGIVYILHCETLGSFWKILFHSVSAGGMSLSPSENM